MRLTGLLLFIIAGALNCHAQSKKVKEADDLYYYHKYHEAINTYKEALEEEKKIDSAHVTRQIAKTYWHLHDYENAEVWYSKLTTLASEYDAESHYEYGQLLRDIGKYKEAKKQFEEYVQMTGKTELQDALFALCDWPLANQDRDRVIIEMTNIETGGVCMGFTDMNGGLLISKPQSQDFDEHTVYYDLAVAKYIDSVNFTLPFIFPGETNHSFYEGAPSFTADGKKVFYTANASENEMYKEKNALKSGISHEGVNVLEIYEASLVNGQWTEVRKLSINDPEHNNAFPHITQDGTRLYFSSDRPGGYGLMDLYVCTKTGDTTWSEPVNLGPQINSFENEIYPYVHNGKFYFSSRGKPGYGGLDMFMADYEVGNIGEPENMGQPLNTEKDEFNMILTTEGDRIGYMASNRDGTHGYDHIYYFHILDELDVMDTISGVVLSQLTEKPLDDVLVRLFEKNDEGEFILIDSMRTGDDGYWEFIVAKNKEYKVEFELEGYTTHKEIIPIDNNQTPSNRDDILTHLNPLELKMSTDPGSVLTLKNIYFDFDKANIRSDSKKILDNLVSILKDNPEMKIELGAHTDAVGPNDYNMRLSHKRAKSCKQYLVDHGISANRLVSKGYGETKIVNGCWKWNDCTEEENEVNRRVEITVLGDMIN